METSYTKVTYIPPYFCLLFFKTISKGLQQVVDEHLRSVSSDVAAAVDDSFLEALNKAWSDHKISMLMIRDILMYMVLKFSVVTHYLQLVKDRVYVMHHNVLPVYDLGLSLFRDNIARSPQIMERLLKTILSLIHRERTGEMVNRGLIKSITQMWIDLGINSRTVYEEDFEKHFLETSATFYRVESQEFIGSNSASDYMKKVSVRIKEEMDRVAHYLDSSTEPKIKEVVERELIACHMKTLIEVFHFLRKSFFFFWKLIIFFSLDGRFRMYLNVER